MKILLVEDDIDLNETIKEYLQNFYEIDSVFDGEEALKKAYENNYDLMIFDVKLPKMDGFSAVKEIRKFKNTPVIFLTSLDSEKDVEEGFLSGGDDYIKKPFSLKELKYRIDAIIKRVYGDSNIVRLKNGFEFDLNNLELKKDNKTIHLKPKVAELLKFFIQNRNRVVSKEEIFEYLYGLDEPNEKSLRTFINNLRFVLGKDSIETISGRGYKFVG
ncbi:MULTISPECIES: response regulator transcription factor [unclassified Lebetimonas]|uniref:response regulator transcription factor n=1 Tax=unclassified Lebetimonas TaxID=2648158 RepID=UPI000464A132|nr:MULTISPECIES: response regulator transcription factor [unclassified Lebetimonas]